MKQNQKMRIVTSTIIILYFTLMVSADCASSPEVLLTEIYATEEKDRPFDTPNDLRSHLNNLSHYYAVVGRPREFSEMKKYLGVEAGSGKHTRKNMHLYLLPSPTCCSRIFEIWKTKLQQRFSYFKEFEKLHFTEI